MQVAYFEVKDDLLLSAATQLNERAEEIVQDLLNQVLVQAAHKAQSGGIDLDVPILILVLLQK